MSMLQTQNLTIYTDGGARGNPGPAGIGAVIYDDNGTKVTDLSEYIGEQTNNFAEYEAVIKALEAARKTFGRKGLKQIQVQVYLDSELVAKQLSGEYQVKEETLHPQFMRVHNLTVADVPHVSFAHVPRSKNKEADRLANEAMDQAD